MDNTKEEIRDKVIDYINSGVSGRLIIYKPEKNIYEADLSVERRANYKEKGMYIQINSLIIPSKDATIFIKDFPQESFNAEKNFYLLFVYFDKERQKIDDYTWLIPSLDFQDIAEVIKLEGDKKIFRFESSADLKKKNKYSRFIIKTEELGKTILKALEKGGKFDFKEIDFEGKNVINLANLKEFIIDARKNTYAADSTPVDNPRLLASKQLEFQKGNYFYRDIYFLGEKKFIGQEIVYQDGKPIWGMNYIGDAIGKLETNFLKESLFRLTEQCRFGGVCEYEKREYKYENQGKGAVEEFSGRELISLEGKNIYKLDYQGGVI
jgi:hypothetical protein